MWEQSFVYFQSLQQREKRRQDSRALLGRWMLRFQRDYCCFIYIIYDRASDGCFKLQGGSVEFPASPVWLDLDRAPSTGPDAALPQEEVIFKLGEVFGAWRGSECLV